MTKFGLEEKSWKRQPSNNWLELDVKSINLPQCINNSIQTSNNDANTNPSNQYEMRRDNLILFATLSHANVQYSYWPQWTLTLCYQTEMWWPSLGWKRNLARDSHLTIEPNLTWNQLICLNASITLCKLPKMIQTQIRATNMRWGGTNLKNLLSCLVPMSNTAIGHSWLSHFVAKQKCDDQIWTGREILQEITVQQLTWN